MDRQLVILAVGLGCLAAGFAAGLLVSGSGDEEASPEATSAREDQPAAAPGEAHEHRAFLRDGPVDLSDLQERFEDLSIVTDVEYVSKEEAVAGLQEQFEGDLGNSLDELENNPLPRSFNIVLSEPLDSSSVSLVLIGAAGPHRDRIDEVASAE